MPWGQVCKPGECHAILDPTEEGDADEVKGTDSMYEFAGINPRITEGELFTKCFPCHCAACRAPTSVSVEYDACPNKSETGFWQRDACHCTRGLVERASKKREDYIQFGKDVRALTTTVSSPAHGPPSATALGPHLTQQPLAHT